MNIATKNGIGLECAKMLGRCEVEAHNVFAETVSGYIHRASFIDQDIKRHEAVYGTITDKTPAYSWSEILWEHAEKFFAKKDLVPTEEHEQYSDCDCSGRDMSFEQHIVLPSIPQQILSFLMIKDYESAEQIFINNCILIK